LPLYYLLILFHSTIFSQGVGKGTRIDLTSKLQLNIRTSAISSLLDVDVENGKYLYRLKQIDFDAVEMKNCRDAPQCVSME